MIKKFAYLFAFASAFSFCVDSSTITLPETMTVSQIGDDPSTRDFEYSKATKNLDKNILEACDNFYYSGIIGAGGADSIKDFLKKFDKKDFSKDHQIVYVQAAKYMISAGIMSSVLSGINSISGELAKWFNFGKSIGEHIQNNPTELLRAEIMREKLSELLQKTTINNKSDIEKYIQDNSKGFDNVFVSTDFLETVHNSKDSKEGLSDSVTETKIMESNNKAGKYAWAGKIVNGIDFTDSAKILIAAIKDEGVRLLKTQSNSTNAPDPYGYNNGSQKLPMVPNLIDRSLKDILSGRQLTEAEKNWCVCKAAIRYLYENPEATINDAVTASINIAQGMLSDNGNYTNPLGDKIEERKSDAVLYLEMIHARDLCQVGRWQEHVGFIEKINSTIIQKRDEPNRYTQQVSTQQYYMPQCKDIPNNKAPELTVPIITKSLTLYDNHGGGHCGIYATLFQSRADLVKWIKTHDEWKTKIPSYLKLAQSTEFLTNDLKLYTAISYSTGYITNKLSDLKNGSIEPAPLVSDFAIIASLIGRSIQQWTVFDESYGVNIPINQFNQTKWAAIIPPDHFFEQTSRAREINIWANGGHFQSLLERHDYIGFAKLMRH